MIQNCTFKKNPLMLQEKKNETAASAWEQLKDNNLKQNKGWWYAAKHKNYKQRLQLKKT